MTLEEAIQHCKEQEINECTNGNIDCTEEHKQLAEWLTELLCMRKNERYEE